MLCMCALTAPGAQRERLFAQINGEVVTAMAGRRGGAAVSERASSARTLRTANIASVVMTLLLSIKSDPVECDPPDLPYGYSYYGIA
eukprot:SAG11_NODE_2460_length_3337_cov_3.537544_2_plen_87_part_00